MGTVHVQIPCSLWTDGHVSAMHSFTFSPIDMFDKPCPFGASALVSNDNTFKQSSRKMLKQDTRSCKSEQVETESRAAEKGFYSKTDETRQKNRRLKC